MFYVKANGTVFYCNGKVYHHILEKYGCLENALDYDLENKTTFSYFSTSIRFELLIAFCLYYGTVKYVGNGRYAYFCMFNVPIGWLAEWKRPTRSI